MKEITIYPTRKGAKELASIKLKCGMITQEQYKEQVKKFMKPLKALIG